MMGSGASAGAAPVKGVLRGAAIGLALALAGCESADGPEPAETAAAPQAGTGGSAAGLPQPTTPGATDAQRQAAAQDAIEVHMALQPDNSGAVSVVFAVDQSRDGTPEDDEAVRISPEGDQREGDCNLQELRTFGSHQLQAQVYGPEQAAQGISTAQLPDYMAVVVTQAMLDAGLAETREQTTPQNVCTKKLWQVLIAANARAAAGG